MNRSWGMKFAGVLGRGVVAVGKGSIKATALTARALAITVKAHEADIARAGKAATKLAGGAVHLAGRGLDTAGSAAARKLAESSKDSGLAVRVAAGTLRTAAIAVGAAGKGVGYIGRGIDAAAPAVGGTLGGAMSGVTNTLSGVVDSAAITESDIRSLQNKLERAGQLSTERSAAMNAKIRQLQQANRKDDLLDLLTIGGLSLASAAQSPADVPANIEQAFTYAYPGLAANGETFGEAAGRMSSTELPGLVNGVKGKLFELELVEQLNEESLPDGFEATLADSATQPGYDIVVTDESNQVVDVLSAKATDSVDYVKAALEKYPDIEVTTTSEVHAQLLSIGMADGVVSSGMSDAALQSAVEAAAAGDEGPLQALAPSAVGLAVIALSAFLDKSISLEARGARFGQRTAKVGLASAAAKGALAASGFWWLGLAAGMGSGWLAGFGENKRLRFEALKACGRSIDKLQRRRQQILLTLADGSRPG